MANKVRKYLYVSQPRRVELYEQTATIRERIRPPTLRVKAVSAELAFDFPEPRRGLAKELKRIVTHLTKTDQIGPLDDPREYFYGQLRMSIVTVDSVRPAMMYLVGESESTVVALAGPFRHYVGNDQASSESGRNAVTVTNESAVVEAVKVAWRPDDSPDDENVESIAPPSVDSWANSVIETNLLLATDESVHTADVEFFAWCEGASAASQWRAAPPAKNVLLGRPVVIMYA